MHMAMKPGGPKSGAKGAVHQVGGRLASKRSKTGKPECSQAMSAWKTSGMTPMVAAVLGKCRAAAHALKGAVLHRSAGNEARAQALEHRAATGKVGAKSRAEMAAGLKAQRAAKAAPAASAPKPGSSFALKQESAVGHKRPTFTNGGGKTPFLFDMKRGDLPGQTSLLERVPSVPTHAPAKPAPRTIALKSRGTPLRKSHAYAVEEMHRQAHYSETRGGKSEAQVAIDRGHYQRAKRSLQAVRKEIARSGEPVPKVAPASHTIRPNLKAPAPKAASAPPAPAPSRRGTPAERSERLANYRLASRNTAKHLARPPHGSIVGRAAESALPNRIERTRETVARLKDDARKGTATRSDLSQLPGLRASLHVLRSHEAATRGPAPKPKAPASPPAARPDPFARVRRITAKVEKRTVQAEVAKRKLIHDEAGKVRALEPAERPAVARLNRTIERGGKHLGKARDALARLAKGSRPKAAGPEKSVHREVLSYFDEKGMNTRGGDVIASALKKASESDLSALERHVDTRPFAVRGAWRRWLGGEIASERRRRAQA